MFLLGVDFPPPLSPCFKVSWFKDTVGREVKNKIKNKLPVAHEKLIIEIFVLLMF